MKRLLAVLTASLILIAAKPVPTGTIEPGPVWEPWRGGIVTFDTTVDKLTGGAYPMVYVACYADGTRLYGQLDQPDTLFKLGGGSSLWLELEPSPSVTCYAQLLAYKVKGGSAIFPLADPVEFHA